jgi:hypothetical protein
MRAASRRHRAWLAALPVTLALLVFAAVTLRLWTLAGAEVSPRHRAEALCFVLARLPAFSPPMTVEPSAALIRGRFGVHTPAILAMQEVMHVGPGDMLRHWAQHLGDYDVETLWLRIPDRTGDRHWLVVGWMEGSDLALCNFRFAGTGPDLSAGEVRWGDALLDRILVPGNFRAGSLPGVRLRPTARGTLPALGPTAAR